MNTNSDDDTKTAHHSNDLSSSDISINEMLDTKKASADDCKVTDHIEAAIPTVPEHNPEVLKKASDSDIDGIKNGHRTSGEIQIHKLEIVSSHKNICYEVSST